MQGGRSPGRGHGGRRGHTGPGQGGRGSGPRGGNKGHYQRRSDGSESLENDVEQFLELTSCTDVSCTLHELTSYMPNVGTLPELTSLVNVSTLPYPTRISATRYLHDLHSDAYSQANDRLAVLKKNHSSVHNVVRWLNQNKCTTSY